jgi:hypothetical protein
MQEAPWKILAGAGLAGDPGGSREPGGAGDAGRLLASFLAACHAGSHPPVADARAAARLP